MVAPRAALLCAILTVLSFAAYAQGKPSPRDAYLYFISPADGATLRGAFWCRFGLRNMGVTHAGDDYKDAGHHHLLIDVDEPIDAREPIPYDRNHVHFAGGATEALVELAPGRHTLQLVLGDANHFPFNPPVVSRKITVFILPE